MLSLSILKSFLISSLDATSCFPWSWISFIYLLPWFSIVFICFSKAFTKGEYVNLACCIILLWSEGSISSPVRYSYLQVLPNYNADTFVASLLISYCSFSSPILSSVAMISFYILSKRILLKHEGISDARVPSITKKEYGFAVHFFCNDS